MDNDSVRSPTGPGAREPSPAVSALRASPPIALLWCCHLRGPDDLIPTATYQEAVEMAYAINTRFEPRHEYDPLIAAVPAFWPWKPEAHAQGIEAQRAETQRGSVEDESPTSQSEDAPESSVIPVTTVKGETL